MTPDAHTNTLLRGYMLCLGLVLATLFSQAKTEVDSLHQALANCENSTQRAELLMSLCTHYRSSHLDSAIHYAEAALPLLASSKQRPLRAKVLSNLGVLYKRQSNYQQALEYHRESLDIYLDRKEDIPVAKTYDNMAIVLRYMGEYETALSYHHKAITLAQKSKEVGLLRKFYANLANIYADRTQYGLAIDYYQKSLTICEDLQDSARMAHLCNNLGSTYYLQDDLPKANAFYRKSLQLYEQLGSDAGQVRLLSNLGNLSYQENQIEEAERYWELALPLAQSIQDRPSEMTLHHQLGLIHLERGANPAAKKELEHAVNIARELGQTEALAELYPNLAKVHQALGETNVAMELLSQSLALKDSLYAVHSAERFSELSVLYESERTQRELAEAKRDLIDSQKTQLLLGAGIGFLLFLIALVLLFLRNHKQKQEHERRMMGQREELNRQIILDLLKAQELESLNAMLEGQEQERQRISAEIHDSLGGTLAAVKVSLFTLQKKLSGQSDDASRAYVHTRDLLEEAYKEVRRISHNLADNVLEQESLVDALSKLCDTLREHAGLTVNLETSGLENVSLEGKTEVQLYRIVQELFQNIIKHARADRVSLQLSLHRDRLSLLIEDDGVGFEYVPEKGSDGIGLANIARRVKQLKGTLEIDSEPGQGTTTIIDVPA